MSELEAAQSGTTEVDLAIQEFRSVNTQIAEQLIAGAQYDDPRMQLLEERLDRAAERLHAAREADAPARSSRVVQTLGRIGFLVGSGYALADPRSAELVRDELNPVQPPKED